MKDRKILKALAHFDSIGALAARARSWVDDAEARSASCEMLVGAIARTEAGCAWASAAGTVPDWRRRRAFWPAEQRRAGLFWRSRSGQ